MSTRDKIKVVHLALSMLGVPVFIRTIGIVKPNDYKHIAVTIKPNDYKHIAIVCVVRMHIG